MKKKLFTGPVSCIIASVILFLLIFVLEDELILLYGVVKYRVLKRIVLFLLGVNMLLLLSDAVEFVKKRKKEKKKDEIL